MKNKTDDKEHQIYSQTESLKNENIGLKKEISSLQKSLKKYVTIFGDKTKKKVMVQNEFLKNANECLQEQNRGLRSEVSSLKKEMDEWEDAEAMAYFENRKLKDKISTLLDAVRIRGITEKSRRKIKNSENSRRKRTR